MFVELADVLYNLCKMISAQQMCGIPQCFVSRFFPFRPETSNYCVHTRFSEVFFSAAQSAFNVVATKFFSLVRDDTNDSLECHKLLMCFALTRVSEIALDSKKKTLCTGDSHV